MLRKNRYIGMLQFVKLSRNGRATLDVGKKNNISIIHRSALIVILVNYSKIWFVYMSHLIFRLVITNCIAWLWVPHLQLESIT
ncbi:hypothetical protein BpHYR1_028096 [Brachionus plicatilis]|uniref:Uncharacterized protein n=1 Tax=Brachionus plicatilis TaxID=10195 RepID=A0A3M7QL54_BRAPC|nr:hypothetical protein BpHYR1_028096 [Brachionus plicatilis]